MALSLEKFFRVYNELRISVRPQFVQIHSLPFPFETHSIRYQPVQELVQSVGGWENKSEQSRDAY